MIYASTITKNGVETVLHTFPLSKFPQFDAENPPVGAYSVPDNVVPGWVKQSTGSFAPPTSTTRIVPQVVSVFQGRAALMQAGYLDEVIAYMAAGADSFEKLAWETITEMRRTSPITIKLGTMLGLTATNMDDLFIFAATISA